MYSVEHEDSNKGFRLAKISHGAPSESQIRVPPACLDALVGASHVSKHARYAALSRAAVSASDIPSATGSSFGNRPVATDAI